MSALSASRKLQGARGSSQGQDGGLLGEEALTEESQMQARVSLGMRAQVRASVCPRQRTLGLPDLQALPHMAPHPLRHLVDARGVAG